MTSYRRLAAALAQELQARCPTAEQPACLETARHILQMAPPLTPLERLALPTAVAHALQRAGHTTIEAAAALTPTQLERIRHLGPVGRQHLQQGLAAWFTPSDPHE